MVDSMVLYANATFSVRDGTIVSKLYPFKRGVRQGCPLSSYPFILVLSVLFEDLHVECRSLFTSLPSVHSDFPITDLKYADDTLLLIRTSPGYKAPSPSLTIFG